MHARPVLQSKSKFLSQIKLTATRVEDDAASMRQVAYWAGSLLTFYTFNSCLLDMQEYNEQYSLAVTVDVSNIDVPTKLLSSNELSVIRLASPYKQHWWLALLCCVHYGKICRQSKAEGVSGVWLLWTQIRRHKTTAAAINIQQVVQPLGKYAW